MIWSFQCANHIFHLHIARSQKPQECTGSRHILFQGASNHAHCSCSQIVLCASTTATDSLDAAQKATRRFMLVLSQLALLGKGKGMWSLLWNTESHVSSGIRTCSPPLRPNRLVGNQRLKTIPFFLLPSPHDATRLHFQATTSAISFRPTCNARPPSTKPETNEGAAGQQTKQQEPSIRNQAAGCSRRVDRHRISQNTLSPKLDAPPPLPPPLAKPHSEPPPS